MVQQTVKADPAAVPLVSEILNGQAGQPTEGPADIPRPTLTRRVSATPVVDSCKDVDDPNTPAYILKLSWYVDHFNWLTCAIYPHILPWIVMAWQWRTGNWLSYGQVGKLFIYGYFKLVITFCIVHRFFSHKTFSTSRPVAFILGIIASTSAQRGPLWWGSKHVRHHKFCENEGDPHSAMRTNMLYAYIGWTVMPTERRVDWAYVHRHFKVPEMLFVEAVSIFIPFIESYLMYRAFGLQWAMMGLFGTSLAVYFTLLFNVGLHHDDSIDKNPDKNGRYKCRAHNNLPAVLKYGLDLMGEMDHHDHHRYPRKALHPSNIFMDLSFWALIWPFEQLGIYYDVNRDGRYRSKDE